MGRKSTALGACISARSHTKDIVVLIKERLKGDTWEEFNRSCFGRLMGLGYGQVKFQLQLLYLAMLRMSEVRRDRGVPVFMSNNTTIEFTKRDFYFMTGLKFGQAIKAPMQSDIHATVFHNLEIIKFCEIKKTFTNACDLLKGDGHICLQLALLVFLYGVVLPRDNNFKTLNTCYLHLVDSVDMFNEFHWGVIAYNYLCTSLFGAYDLMMPKVKSKNSKEQPAFDVCGFLFALQCWFYEVLPTVGDTILADCRIEHSNGLEMSNSWMEIPKPLKRIVRVFEVASLMRR